MEYSKLPEAVAFLDCITGKQATAEFIRFRLRSGILTLSVLGTEAAGSVEVPPDSAHKDPDVTCFLPRKALRAFFARPLSGPLNVQLTPQGAAFRAGRRTAQIQGPDEAPSGYSDLPKTPETRIRIPGDAWTDLSLALHYTGTDENMPDVASVFFSKGHAYATNRVSAIRVSGDFPTCSVPRLLLEKLREHGGSVHTSKLGARYSSSSIGGWIMTPVHSKAGSFPLSQFEKTFRDLEAQKPGFSVLREDLLAAAQNLIKIDSDAKILTMRTRVDDELELTSASASLTLSETIPAKAPKGLEEQFLIGALLPFLQGTEGDTVTVAFGPQSPYLFRCAPSSALLVVPRRKQ